jgi:imidazolonepropionase-like amidohydrolase
LLEDLRLVHEIAPEIPMEELWGLVTVRAARAIDAAELVGSLTAGKQADLAAFPVSTGNPLLEIIESNRAPGRLWISGTAVDVP